MEIMTLARALRAMVRTCLQQGAAVAVVVAAKDAVVAGVAKEKEATRTEAAGGNQVWHNHSRALTAAAPDARVRLMPGQDHPPLRRVAHEGVATRDSWSASGGGSRRGTWQIAPAVKCTALQRTATHRAALWHVHTLQPSLQTTRRKVQLYSYRYGIGQGLTRHGL